jgi:coenzyme F420-reducing hydrogenase gamma subunit
MPWCLDPSHSDDIEVLLISGGVSNDERFTAQRSQERLSES